MSAPRGRVDLVALKRPRLGGKEPSDDDYRLRFAHTLPAVEFLPNGNQNFSLYVLKMRFSVFMESVNLAVGLSEPLTVGFADYSTETLRPTGPQLACLLSKGSSACYGPKPRFMSQSG